MTHTHAVRIANTQARPSTATTHTRTLQYKQTKNKVVCGARRKEQAKKRNSQRKASRPSKPRILAKKSG